MAGKILTLMEYAAAIDRVHATERRELLERFVVGAAKYGALDLTARDWPANRHEEQLDQRAYDIFELERIRLGLPAAEKGRVL